MLYLEYTEKLFLYTEHTEIFQPKRIRWGRTILFVLAYQSLIHVIDKIDNSVVICVCVISLLHERFYKRIWFFRRRPIWGLSRPDNDLCTWWLSMIYLSGWSLFIHQQYCKYSQLQSTDPARPSCQNRALTEQGLIHDPVESWSKERSSDMLM